MPNVHTYPLDDVRPHDTEGLTCWCGPAVSQACSACEGEAGADCYRCEGKGWEPCAIPELYDGIVGLHIVHRRVADDP
ncbi:hypothetical protein [Gemmatirosa kalamazoonensis]|uniref:hypothetical protein n=1 Tax=Gemmatirosa kalamazoonensis TaxID=861299 RepID=UPI0011DE1CEA|nr:hypothetical protein [Gemmatirosa kalamazoonensis]